MKYAKQNKSGDFFPGAIVYYVVNGDKRIKLRGKIKSIKNHCYDSTVYDKMDGESEATYDCQMTGVRVSCGVLEDLFFRKEEYPNLRMILFYHTNLMERINCVVVCLENNGRKQFFMFVPCKESMIKLYIHHINDLNGTLTWANAMIVNDERLNNFEALKSIAEYFGTKTVEEVVYVHNIQTKYTKHCGHPLKLHWRPLPNMEGNPKFNQYPEDWYEAWNNADGVACLEMKHVYLFSVDEAKDMTAVYPITKEVMEYFFSIPLGVDKDAFLSDLEYEYFDDIVDKYPEIIARINDTVRFIIGSSHEDYSILGFDFTFVRNREIFIPQYKNLLFVTFQLDEEAWPRFNKQVKTIFNLPKEQLPEQSFFYNNYDYVDFRRTEGDSEKFQNAEKAVFSRNILFPVKHVRCNS